jgi:hypothetical protein
LIFSEIYDILYIERGKKMIKISDIWTWEEWLQAINNQRKENENER